MIHDIRCPECGDRVYTYGLPLSGQYIPPKGEVFTGLRSRLHCVKCDWNAPTVQHPTTDPA